MDLPYKSQIVELLAEADRATDAQTNGLLDRDEMVLIIARLAEGTRSLLDAAVTQHPLQRQMREDLNDIQAHTFHM
jgi:hypothetical protein